MGLLATLAHWKGHEVFLRALSLVSSKLRVRGYVIGDALYQTEGSQTSLDELRTIAQRLGLADRVGFTGFVEDSAAAMRALDIVVHASTQPEPFGLVIVEGMACGRPVIVSEAGGAAELMNSNGKAAFEPHSVIALGHPPGDAEQLAERITQLASSPELRARLGAAGRVSAEQRFNRERMAQKLIPVYERVSSQNAASGLKA